MKTWGGVLIRRERELGDCQSTIRDTARRRPPTNWEEDIRQNLTIPAPKSQTPNLQNWEKINFYCLSNPVYSILQINTVPLFISTTADLLKLQIIIPIFQEPHPSLWNT